MFHNNTILFLIGSLCILMASCEKPNEENGNGDNGNGNTVELKVECQTLVVTELEHSSANLNGSASISNAKSEKGEAYFYYSNTASDASSLKKGTKVNAGEVSANSGSFSVLLSNLEPSTQYYYIAAVSIDGNDFFGGIKSFTTKETPKELAVTGVATDITEKSVTLSGSVNPKPDMQDVLMGVLYSLDSSPNIENSTKVQAKDITDNSFTITIDDLPSSTTYYFKTYIQYNGAQYRFGEIKSFSTADVTAEVSTLDASDITEFKGTLNGKLEATTKASLSKEVWFLFGNASSTVETLKENGEKLTCTLSNGNTFKVSLSDLVYGATYHYVAVAKIYDKVFYGDLVSFSTNQISATIVDDSASGITEFNATLNAKLNFESAESLDKSVWFLLSETESSIDGLIANGKKYRTSLNDDGSFSYSLSGLKYGQQYYFIAAAKIHDKYFYSEQTRTFTTTDITIDIRTESATNITYSEATMNGTIVSISNESFLKNVYFLISNEESTLDGLISNGGKMVVSTQGVGPFSCNLGYLPNGTQYYYVAVADVYDKQCYGEVKSFTTLAYSLEVSTMAADNLGVSSCTLHGKVTSDTDVIPFAPFFYYSDVSSTVEGLIDSGIRVDVMSNSDKTFSCKLSNLNPKTQYFFVSGYKLDGIDYFGDISSFTTNEQVLVPVDLGLSVKWASCNIGASAPEEHGCYYCWGEVKTKASYTLYNYKWYKKSDYNGSGTEITKYCTSTWSSNPDNKHVLDSEDDAAYVVTKGSWRMPSNEEIKELFNNCTWEYSTRSGVIGYNVTSKINGNSIFLPGSGVFNGTSCSPGQSASYFSTYTLGDGTANTIYFNGTSRLELGRTYRYQGHTVRPVCD